MGPSTPKVPVANPGDAIASKHHGALTQLLPAAFAADENLQAANRAVQCGASQQILQSRTFLKEL